MSLSAPKTNLPTGQKSINQSINQFANYINSPVHFSFSSFFFLSKVLHLCFAPKPEHYWGRGCGSIFCFEATKQQTVGRCLDCCVTVLLFFFWEDLEVVQRQPHNHKANKTGGAQKADSSVDPKFFEVVSDEMEWWQEGKKQKPKPKQRSHETGHEGRQGRFCLVISASGFWDINCAEKSLFFFSFSFFFSSRWLQTSRWHLHSLIRSSSPICTLTQCLFMSNAS